MEQVLVGQLKNPTTIITDQKETLNINSWHGKAIWSYLRLHNGKRIDALIKERLGGERMADHEMKTILGDLFPKQQRTLQFIMSADNQVIAVATTRHLVTPPEMVYRTAEEILGKKLTMSSKLDGGSVLVRKVAGLRYGIQISGGSITTRFAIRVGALIRVELCFNPLSWLGVGNFKRFGITSAYERVLRIQRTTELRPRLVQAIYNGKHGLKKLRGQIQHAKKVSLSETQARILTFAMCKSYGLGRRTMETVLERFTQEKQTQYGLAMALSWVAEHGELKKTAEDRTSHARQSLSTVGAGVLLIDDVPKTTEKSQAWLKKCCPGLFK